VESWLAVGQDFVVVDIRLTSEPLIILELQMSRIRKRVCLQEGPFLNLQWLFKNTFLQPGEFTPGRTISWTLPSYGVIASGLISADLRGATAGWLKIWIDDFSQEIALGGQSRNFGGRQWYFICPITGHLASVVWRPPGARLFASRHAWPTQVAYLSQFGSWIDRAHLGKARIKARLLGDCDPNEWELPPRPRGMRAQTYDRLVARFDVYQSKLDNGLAALASKWSP
jgi:hypothetical protein